MEVETLRKDLHERLEIRNTVVEMKNIPYGFLSGPYMAKKVS